MDDAREPTLAEQGLPLILDPDELEPHLGEEGVLVVDLSRPEIHARFHVPGAVHLDYAQLVTQRGPATGMLPDEPHLTAVFSSLGLTPDTHVVAYDDEGGGKAGRLLWTLDVVGHRHFSLLNGGLHAWLNEGHPTSSEITRPTPSHCPVSVDREKVPDAEYLLAHLGDPDWVVVDARSANEYRGLTQSALRNGHIPGAVNLEWTFAMDTGRNLRLKHVAELEQVLHELGVTRDKQVIVHCQTHHRSSYTYAVLKALGYPRVKGYAGSWSEWGNRTDTPVEQGPGQR